MLMVTFFRSKYVILHCFKLAVLVEILLINSINISGGMTLFAKLLGGKTTLAQETSSSSSLSDKQKGFNALNNKQLP